MTRTEILQSALTARNEEILGYQINIDNYTRAIAKINNEYHDKPAMQEFKANLEANLDSSITEQLKAKIIRDVIADQLQELEGS